MVPKVTARAHASTQRTCVFYNVRFLVILAGTINTVTCRGDYPRALDWILDLLRAYRA
jgi:hypothetical protein